MEKKKILLALKEDDEERRFNRCLAEAGFRIVPARDGAMALELAIHEVPSLIVCEPALPVISGERLFQILRHNPHTSGVPFLFISDRVVDIRGFRTGRDAFLVKPLNIEELKARIDALTSTGSAGDHNEIEGSLAHMGVADILQFMHLNKKEGELRVTADGSTGRVFLKNGEVYNSVYGTVDREKALFRLLQITEGKFEFLPRTISLTKKIRPGTGNLLMEGMRQMDELKKTRSQLPGPDAILKPLAGREDLPKGLQGLVYEIADLVKEHPRVEDLVERCPYPDYEVLRAISTMTARGMLEESSPAPGREPVEDEFLTPDQALSIREKIITQFSDMRSSDRGKVLVISTSAHLAAGFTDLCGQIRGFSLRARERGADAFLGAVASYRLYGGMELELYSIPSVRDMGPLLRAFLTNIVGLIVVWDDAGSRDLKALLEAKRDILLKKRVPVVHVNASSSATEEDTAFFKKTLELKADEPVFTTDLKDTSVVPAVFYSLFAKLLKDDYITG